jgi:hypothetical protein
MMLHRRRPRLRSRLALLVLATVLGVGRATPAVAQGIPARLTDEAFWRLVTDFSEPGGFFRSDNFVSNETTFQHVVPSLRATTKPGGVYMGVGPDQNFTYIVALQPRIAFVTDIRRQNLLQHLMYKALLEMSADRADFLSRLFSRPRPRGLDSTSTVIALFAAYASAQSDSALFRRNFTALRSQLVDRHRFGLSADDLSTIEYVYSAFYMVGPDLTYSFSNSTSRSGFGRRMPTYGELMIETDADGRNLGYLATEASFRALVDLQRRNLIVPLVGDFAGDKTIRAVGKYVRDNNAIVTAFYLSNVEQYLFQQADDWRRFFSNVATLPVDSTSTFIRAVFNNVPLRVPSTTPGPRSVTMLAPIGESVRMFNEGRIGSYWDVIQMSR